jgi:predicted metal-dependent hydrolase
MNLLQLQELGKKLAQAEGLALKAIFPLKNDRTIVGKCLANGLIYIRMHKNNLMTDETKDQENLRTLAHELAHLKYKNHDKEFWDYAEYLCKQISLIVGKTVKAEIAMVR